MSDPEPVPDHSWVTYDHVGLPEWLYWLTVGAIMVTGLVVACAVLLVFWWVILR